jgi:TonB family protein
MFKSLLILVLPVAFLTQCGANRKPSAEEVAEHSQPVSPHSNTENRRCDFSERKAMKARANHGAPMLSMPKPAYPPQAKGRGIEGTVVVLLLVNVRSGLVEETCVMEGDDSLASSAREAAARAKFHPYSSYIQERYSYAEEILSYKFVAE